MPCPEMIKNRLDINYHSESKYSPTRRTGNSHAKFRLDQGFIKQTNKQKCFCFCFCFFIYSINLASSSCLREQRDVSISSVSALSICQSHPIFRKLKSNLLVLPNICIFQNSSNFCGSLFHCFYKHLTIFNPQNHWRDPVHCTHHIPCKRVIGCAEDGSLYSCNHKHSQRQKYQRCMLAQQGKRHSTS